MSTNSITRVASRTCNDTVELITFQHPLCRKYPPSQKYQKQFLKYMINKIEANGHPCSEDFYSLYVQMLDVTEQTTACKSYYLPSVGEFVTLQENTNMLSNGTTGLVTWKGGLFLAEWCLANSSLFCGRHIFELGSGCGVTGIAVAKCVSIKSYTFSDCHNDVIKQLEMNLKINRLTDEKYQVKNFDWDSDEYEVKTDVVLAADVVFDPSIIPSLVGAMFNLLSSNHCVAYVACTVRNIDTYNTFIKELGSKKLLWNELDTSNADQIFYYDRNDDLRVVQIHCD